MKELIPSFVYLNIPFFIILILAVTTGTVTYFYYKRTIPPVSIKYRLFLGLSRGIALFLILLLIFAPQLKLMWTKVIKPKLMIAVDQSASMKIKDDRIERFENVKKITRFINEQFESDFNLHFYAFDLDTASMIPDSIKAGNLGTNIDLSLSNIIKKHKETNAIILISDGIVTEGNNPLFSDHLKKTKIFTIGVGDTINKPDVLIKNTRINSIVYKNKPVTLTTEITSYGVDNFAAAVELKHKGKVLAAKNITLSNDGFIQNVDFEITPKELGILKYEIEIENMESEELLENNKTAVYMDVLKDKLNIGILAATPSYDAKFLKRIISESKDYNTLFFSRQKPGLYDRRQIKIVLDSSDILILIDFPGKDIPVPIINSIISTLEKKSIPLLFLFTGRSNNLNDIIIKKTFPDFIWKIAPQIAEVLVKPTISGKLNPVLNIFEFEELNENFWLNCSPVEYPFYNIIPGKTDKILLEVSGSQSKQPVLIYNNQNKTKNILLLGAGFWRWKFLMSEDKQLRDGWSAIIQNLMRWMSQSKENKNVNIAANKKIISLGEQLQLNIQLYDGSFNPVPDGHINLKVSGSSGEFETEATHSGQGIYSWQYTPFSEGKYLIRAIASGNDVPLGEAEIEINVVPVNKEFLYTKQDKELLQNLAKSNGGLYFGINNYKQIKDYLPKTNKIQSQIQTFELWNILPMLLLIILLLSIEWFVRKRKGLA